MAYYITLGEFQQQLKNYYLRTGNKLQFPEMATYLYVKGMLSEALPAAPSFSGICPSMSETDFNRIIDAMSLSLVLHQPAKSNVKETDIFPESQDVFVIRHPRYTRPALHTHNYFEINYVASGQCRFSFETETRTLTEGELCIIAPFSLHDIYIEDDSTVYCIMLRKSTFQTTFFSLLSGNDMLSFFFRSILQDGTSTNYLLFFADTQTGLRDIFHNAIIENSRTDHYSNTCCISWIYLLFSYLLRNYSQTLQFYHYPTGSDFSLVLQYIQHNYQTLSLSSLASLFHYSEAHLCTLIRKNTGCNFTGLIRQLRLTDAVTYLCDTTLSIQEIAARVGYHSADHFSRVFRNTYHQSPSDYRQNHTRADDSFVPFSTT